MEKSDLTLLGTWACPYVNRVQLALKIKSIDHEFIEDIPYKKSEILLKHNPIYQKIPVLVHGDRSVCESLNILHYIDDAWSEGPSILSFHAYDRALERLWAAYIDDKWYPLVKVLREAGAEEERTTLTEKVRQGLVLLEEAFLNCSKGKPYFGGDNIGYLDIVLGSTLGWFRVTEIVVGIKLLHENTTPMLSGWANRFCSDDVVKDVLPETQKLLELYKKIQDILKAAPK